MLSRKRKRRQPKFTKHKKAKVDSPFISQAKKERKLLVTRLPNVLTDIVLEYMYILPPREIKEDASIKVNSTLISDVTVDSKHVYVLSSSLGQIQYFDMKGIAQPSLKNRFDFTQYNDELTCSNNVLITASDQYIKTLDVKSHLQTRSPIIDRDCLISSLCSSDTHLFFVYHNYEEGKSYLARKDIDGDAQYVIEQDHYKNQLAYDFSTKELYCLKMSNPENSMCVFSEDLKLKRSWTMKADYAKFVVHKGYVLFYSQKSKSRLYIDAYDCLGTYLRSYKMWDDVYEIHSTENHLIIRFYCGKISSCSFGTSKIY